TGGIFHTVGSNDNYWQVDLGSSQPISAIDISARTDGWNEQLTGYYVFASDQPFASELFAPTVADPNVSTWYVGPYSLITKITANRTARYVRLQRAGSGTSLVFTEVRVWSQQANTKLLSIPAAAATK
ncbi:MAG TPA: discoidin domain-containing protein, partial [Thermoanaerobaculia bacterium]|nr:discoidin domain-containing protein [Thermoanaerobaculia bacterium]